MFWETLDRCHCLADHYPHSIQVRDGNLFSVRPVTTDDREHLNDYLQSVPADEQLFLRHDVSLIAEQLCDHVNSLHSLSLLLLIRDPADRVVADGMLYQEPGLWTMHIGKLRLFVHPQMRGQGIGTGIIDDLLAAGRMVGLNKVVAECPATQPQMMSLLSNRGFIDVARLPEFIKDRKDRLHDMVLMVHDLK